MPIGPLLLERAIQLAPLLVIGMAVEQFAFADGHKPFRSTRFNLAYMVIVGSWQVLVIALFNAYLAARLEALPALVNLRVTATSPAWAPWVAGFAWLMLRDFFYYWFHRLQHSTKWLWWEHELHHSDPNMNVTTGGRHHWLELPLLLVFQVIPFNFLVHANPIVAFAGSAFGDLLGCFTHMNSRVSFGRLSWMVTNPQVHRIHHSIESKHRNKNFAAYCPLWDVIFGTYYAPTSDEFPQTGLKSGRIPSFGDAFAVRLPLRRRS